MKTELAGDVLATAAGREADRILRSCVHCGFCNATCPTYQVAGSELDGPRGRIYLIKAMLEGEAVSATTRFHLDRCLGCQACETTCPSGVDYHRLWQIGRGEIDKRAPRPRWRQWLRKSVVALVSRRRWFTPAARLGRRLRWMLPPPLSNYLPRLRPAISWRAVSCPRRMILVQGCVQPGLSPDTNRAAALVLAHLGIETIAVESEQCCGAMASHLGETERGLQQARANIDAWWPHLQQGLEAIVMTASGCSNFVRDYDYLLKDDARYSTRAKVVLSKLRDISEVLVDEDLECLQIPAGRRISWHCPCTAQHGQKLDGPTRQVLTRLGFSLPPVDEAHLCCGSAGAYSLFQPAMAKELRSRKLQALERSEPELIVTANIGCQVYLGGATQTPVVHWVELLAREMTNHHGHRDKRMKYPNVTPGRAGLSDAMPAVPHRRSMFWE